MQISKIKNDRYLTMPIRKKKSFVVIAAEYTRLHLSKWKQLLLLEIARYGNLKGRNIMNIPGVQGKWKYVSVYEREMSLSSLISTRMCYLVSIPTLRFLGKLLLGAFM